MSLNAEEATQYVRAVYARLLADQDLSPAAKAVIRGDEKPITSPVGRDGGAT